MYNFSFGIFKDYILENKLVKASIVKLEIEFKNLFYLKKKNININFENKLVKANIIKLKNEKLNLKNYFKKKRNI